MFTLITALKMHKGPMTLIQQSNLLVRTCHTAVYYFLNAWHPLRTSKQIRTSKQRLHTEAGVPSGTAGGCIWTGQHILKSTSSQSLV